MTQTQESSSDRPARPWWRARLWGGVTIVVVVAIAAWMLTPVAPRQAKGEIEQRDRLLRLGAALRQYAGENSNALPERIPPALFDVTSGTPITYSVVTPGGERIGYEQYGERVIAWTEPNQRGRRVVLYNGLDEAVHLAAEDLDLAQQQVRGSGGLNRVRSTESTSPRGGGGGPRGRDEVPDAAAPTDAEPAPATGPGR